MAEEESEFDREEDDERLECGHTAEEHKKMERIQKNFKKFLTDNAEDMLDPKMFEELCKKVENRLKHAHLSSSLTSLKIFREGFEFGVMAHINVPNEIHRVFAGLNKMVSDKEKKKLDIDIAASKPLPPPNDQEGLK